MGVTILDLSNLTALQVATMAVLLAAVDTGWNVVTALAAKTFDLAKVALFLESHVLLRIFPILALAVLGAGAFGLPAFPALFALSIGGLAAYAAETVGSVIATAPPAPAA